MKSQISSHRFVAVLFAAAVLAPANAFAQDRLKSMPGYERYQEVGKKIAGSVKLGSLSVHWSDDGKSFEYQKDGKKWLFDIALKSSVEAPKPKDKADEDPKPDRSKRRNVGG